MKKLIGDVAYWHETRSCISELVMVLVPMSRFAIDVS
jgi:hypothetical protein